MPKGITPVISVILLLLITIAIVGFAMLFMQRSVQTTSEESEQQLAKQTSSLGENFEIININDNQVTVRNKGTAELKNLAFYVDGNKMTASGSSISKDGIGTFTLDAAQLAQYQGRKLKVSSAGMSKEEDANFYATNTVAYYTFDSTDGRTIKDESGNGNDGTFNGEAWNDGSLMPSCPNCPQQVEGKLGNALSFDGIDDIVNVPPSPSIGSISDEMTVEAWVNLQNFTNGHFVRVNAVTTGHFLGFYGNGGGSPKELCFEVRNAADVGTYTCYTYSSLTAGTWHHYAGTVKAGQFQRFYIDGVLVATAPAPATISQPTSIVLGGTDWSTPPQWPVNGTIDEVRIYNRALSPQEITEDMNSAYPIYRPVASWSFESVSANQVKDTHNVVKGQYGSALSFDGINDYIDAGDAGEGNENPTSISMWIKPANLNNNWRWAIGKTISGTTYPLSIIIDASNRLDARLYAAGVIDAIWTTALQSDTWYHVVAAYDQSLASNNLKLYANGVLRAQTTTNSCCDINTVNYKIGTYDPATYFWNGTIDEVRILNKAIG